MNPRVWLSVAFLIYRLGLFGAADQCGVIDYSVYGMYLKGHTYKTVQAGFPTECYLICEQETRCQSYNVIIGRNICELNSRTKEARPEDFEPDHRRFYMKRTINRGRFFFFLFAFVFVFVFLPSSLTLFVFEEAPRSLYARGLMSERGGRRRGRVLATKGKKDKNKFIRVRRGEKSTIFR